MDKLRRQDQSINTTIKLNTFIKYRSVTSTTHTSIQTIQAAYIPPIKIGIR